MSGKIIEDKRISSRRRKLVLKKWLSVLWIFLFAVLFGLVIWGSNYFYNSDYFKIKKIEIKGNNFYKSEEIAAAAEGLAGTNIFEVDKKKYENILLGSFARIKTVQISKIFPDSLVISVTERKPFLILFYRNQYILVDNEGVVLEKNSDIDEEKYGNLLIVKDVINYDVEVGEKIAKKNVLSAADIYNSFNEEIKKNINFAGIAVEESGDIFFKTQDGKMIIYGNSSEITKKNTVLEQILKDLHNENIYYSIIDLRITDNPVVK